MEVFEVRSILTRVNRLASGRAQRQEDYRLEHVHHLAHQKEPGESVLAGRPLRNISADRLAGRPHCRPKSSLPLPSQNTDRLIRIQSCGLQCSERASAVPTCFALRLRRII
jgi:hypothetical protein